MQVKTLTESITEPVTSAQIRDFMGYPSHDQDDLIDSLIISARQWLEDRTGLSLVSKSYTAYFEKGDDVNGWFELPFSPVTDDPAIAVSINGVADTAFEQRGQDRLRIKPSTVIGSIPVGASSISFYVEVTFRAGASNTLANNCIKRIVTSMFNQREDGIDGVNTGRLPYDTLRMIDMLDQNTGL